MAATKNLKAIVMRAAENNGARCSKFAQGECGYRSRLLLSLSDAKGRSCDLNSVREHTVTKLAGDGQHVSCVIH